jgi:TetR/AcrR family fatty acid metabolism transcriptional regulator
MNTKKQPTGQEQATFISSARRAQIVNCATMTLAELGYAQTSIARIAERAAISKGVITYHFASKTELIGAVVGAVLSDFAAFVEMRVKTESSAQGTLQSFIKANIEFMGLQRTAMLALLEILNNGRTETGASMVNPALVESDITRLEALLLQGQQQGEFRAFDTRVMAVAIMSLRSGVLTQLAINPQLDLEAYAREFATLIELATRRTP